MGECKLPHDHGQNIYTALEYLPGIEKCNETADLFKLISDGSRLGILWLLCHCEECLSNLSIAMNMSSPAVSHHLKILKNGGIITSRRSGKEVYYKISKTPEAELLHRVCEEMFQISCPFENQKIE